MPFDGTDYQPEQSLELKALRHALAFFSDESRWHRGMDCFGPGQEPNRAKCVGAAICYGAKGGFTQWNWISEILGITDSVGRFNRDCPDFATLIAHLKTRIAYYESQRMSAYAKASVDEKVAA